MNVFLFICNATFWKCYLLAGQSWQKNMVTREIILSEKYLPNFKFKISLKYLENILTSLFWNLAKCKISKSEVKFIGKVKVKN